MNAMRMTSYVAACWLLIGASLSQGDELATQIEKIILSDRYKHAKWTMKVVEAESGKTVYERNPNQLMVPASVTKLYTCANALNEIGGDFRFKTPVVATGVVKQGVLQGDIILVGSGDPTFGSRRRVDGKTAYLDNDHTYANGGTINGPTPDVDPLFALRELAKQIKTQGIREITGEVMVDNRLFPKTSSAGSGPNYVTPLAINDNCLDIVVTPSERPGALAKVTMSPMNEFFQLDAVVKTAGPKETLSIEVEQTADSQIMVRGRIPVGHAPVLRIFSVDYPTEFARSCFVQVLREAGITCQCNLQRARKFDFPVFADYPKMPKIAEYESEPFGDVIKVTLKVSHNLYSSEFPILVGWKTGTATAEAGIKRQAEFLKSIGLDPKECCFATGAAAAMVDTTTANHVVKLIQAMTVHRDAKFYFGALPEMGVDGTLAETVGKDSPIRGKARAKTGTLVWFDQLNNRPLLRSKALAGVLDAANGKTYYFAMFLNDQPIGKDETAVTYGKVLGQLCEIIHKHAGN